ncbi:ATP-binding protein [Agrobacterium tumefaciens]|uniref:ATPase n=1 Tax=Agrobacterium tumefaciens TaxID=358 RepID=A0A176XGN7_AGRTU|nr:ATP-binding protein [Agrobacterium tumefaciens]OAE48427.1 ATPase [Agrobacterium tumefaciens]
MIERRIETELRHLVDESPAVALLGPRQVGKTTLAINIGENRPSIYLDLESEADRAKLAEPELYLASHDDKLVILDEVHRLPNVFQILRGLIDRHRRAGRRTGQFLLLGSASIDLLKQSGETLAGRIAYLEMQPVDGLEVPEDALERLWLRGGFPDSFLASSDRASLRWRQDFIRTYLERDIPLLGPRIPAETLRRFWTMLAHHQSGLLNAAELARSLGVDGKTVASYLDLLVDLLLVRRLEPWHANVGKRLVKSPKVYVRDSGIAHALLGLGSAEQLLGHPIVGSSWEGFVIETLIASSPDGTTANFYRTAAGAEIDLLLTPPGEKPWAIEIKRSLTPKLEKGFHLACEDLQPQKRIVIYPGQETFPLPNGVTVMPLSAAGRLLLDRESNPH